ncbi:STM4014 family protein [Thermobifida halotolerans]|uniref:STM4014 family protein n=1 Tax=Thermobifida halotolerans TaxID=483545 RepID=A0A399G2J8_9ACTN|nr:STM4014 family protein [Thermobifida halotolerans]UOE19828.1 STM4014 family protein [Thermobifida halotolerans]
MSTARLAVVAVPGSRRLRLFTDAVRAAGLPAPVLLPWPELAAGHVRVPPGALVRVDSPGEDTETARLLSGLDRAPDPYRVEGGTAFHMGLRSALDRLAAAVAETPGARLLQDTAELAAMCDKRRCHALLDAAGVPVPPALDGPPADYADLRARMAERGWSRVFAKPVHGSSASGVVALATRPDRVRAVTSADLVRTDTGVELYNSLALRTYTDEADVAAVVDTLCAEGVHVERWLPKAGLHNRTIDLRVLVVAGQATHVVVRASRSPMTNLHLGNARGDLAALRERMGERAWHSAMRTAEAAAACFPRTLHAGVDLLLAPGWHTSAVCEVNAFGDLLPGILHEGRDTYAEQVDAVVSGRFTPPPPNRTHRAHSSMAGREVAVSVD